MLFVCHAQGACAVRPASSPGNAVEQHLIWFVVAGMLFISMALAGSAISRLPLTTAMLYLVVGVLLGPQVAGLLQSRRRYARQRA